MRDLANQLKRAFKDRDYRHGYVDEFLNASIATQIKVLREERGWSQRELAERSGMKQPRISLMENVNYSSWSIAVLRKLAEAFDLALGLSFESFSTRVNDIETFSRATLERRSFDEDLFFQTADATTAADITRYPLKQHNVVSIDGFILRKNAISAPEFASVREATADSTSITNR